MATCVPIRDLRDTAAFDAMIEASAAPVTVTKNGYDRFVCIRSADFERYEQADARARLLEHMLLAEEERAAGRAVDAREALSRLRAQHGL